MLQKILTSEDYFLLRTLAILDVRIAGYCLKPYEKYLSITIKIVFSIFTTHWILSAIYRISTHDLYGLVAYVYASLPLKCILIRCILNSQGKNVATILQKLYKYRSDVTNGNNQKYLTRGNKKQYLGKIFTLSLLSLPCVIAFIDSILDKS